jgi:hypothetical protein
VVNNGSLKRYEIFYLKACVGLTLMFFLHRQEYSTYSQWQLKGYEIFYLKCIESDLKHVCVQAYSGVYISKNTVHIVPVAIDGSLKR